MGFFLHATTTVLHGTFAAACANTATAMAATALELRHLRRGMFDLLITIAFLVIVATVYHYESGSNWSYETSLYFMVVSLLGIGFGEVVPKNEDMRLFTAVFRLVCTTVDLILPMH